MEGTGMVESTGTMKSTIILAQDGIFPITQDKNGKKLPQIPASGLNFPGTIQGEGKLNGIPSLFVRLAGCNLHCTWQTNRGTISACDTAYAAYAVKNSYSLSVEEIYKIVKNNTENIRHLVITGGEPFLQAEALQELCQRLKQDRYHLTVETNATLFNAALASHIDLFSLSPKLKSSVPPPPFEEKHDRIRLDPVIIRKFIEFARLHHKDFQLKFVYAAEKDIEEIHFLLSQLQDWKNEDILLMPLGSDAIELRLNAQKTLEHCIRNGWRYCDRLHISLFGSKQGV